METSRSAPCRGWPPFIKKRPQFYKNCNRSFIQYLKSRLRRRQAQSYPQQDNNANGHRQSQGSVHDIGNSGSRGSCTSTAAAERRMETVRIGVHHFSLPPLEFVLIVSLVRTFVNVAYTTRFNLVYFAFLCRNNKCPRNVDISPKRSASPGGEAPDYSPSRTALHSLRTTDRMGTQVAAP